MESSAWGGYAPCGTERVKCYPFIPNQLSIIRHRKGNESFFIGVMRFSR